MNAKPCILIVDDDESSRRTLALILEKKGHETETAGTGREAIEKARERSLNLALLDIKLPDMGGVELIAPLKEMHPDMAVIMITAYAALETAVQALNEGASAYVTKPLNMDAVLATVREALEKQRLVWEKQRAEEALQRSERQLAIRNRISNIFPTVPDEEMYGEVLQIVLEIMESKYGIFGYIDENEDLVCSSMTRDIWEQCQIPDKDIVFPRETWGGIWGRALTEKKTLYSSEPFPAPKGHIPIHRALDVPIVHRGEVIGNLLVGNKATDYGQEDCKLLEAIADHIDPILYARLQRDGEERGRQRAEEKLRRSYVELRRTLEGTVNVLTSAVEMRDPHTAGHQRRVSALAYAIATEMGLSEERVEGLRIAGLIHDVGKFHIPAAILSKPGRLSELEYGLIKAHPQVGYDILKGVDFPWPVAEMVLQHHERMDGSGYPQGLSGEEIMLEARILAVADVVEAMASHRPYRPARGIDKALEEISQNRGVLYDPEVVDACLRLFIEKGFAFE